MPWPTGESYVRALQHPELCFRNAQLKVGVPYKTKLGLPRPMTGRFAIVFRLTLNNGQSRAVRCFLSEVADIGDRYQAIRDYLSYYRSSSPWLTAFDYENEGIRIGDSWYPILVMDWVDGQTLGAVIESHHRDRQLLNSLADKWVTLNASLEKAGIAHGDLQHENVLIHGNDFRLVDYDGMYVPRLKGQRAANLGHPNYQHPSRTSAEFSAEVDRFSALVIYTAIKALASQPALWQRYNMPDDALLFRRTDFTDPSNSPLFRDLIGSPDPAISQPAQILKETCIYSKGLPPLSEIISSYSTTLRRSQNNSRISKPTSLSSEGKSTSQGSTPWWRTRLDSDKRPNTKTSSSKEKRDSLLWQALRERVLRQEESFTIGRDSPQEHSTEGEKKSLRDTPDPTCESDVEPAANSGRTNERSFDPLTPSPLKAEEQRFEYVGDRKVREFHRSDCRIAGQITGKALARFYTPEQAYGAGYVPCSTCRPLQGRLPFVRSATPRRPTKTAARVSEVPKVRIGMTVEVEYSNGTRQQLLIVQSLDGHRDKATVTANSPVGQAILGKPIGSTQYFSVNGIRQSVRSVKIISVS